MDLRGVSPRARGESTEVTQTTAATEDTSAERGVAADLPDLPRGATIGRYVLLGSLGVGGMGVVLAAYDPELDRKVALKVLHDLGPGDPRRRARLLREAQALARVAHPNVVAVHDVGTVGDRLFIAMELVEGVTLADALAERRRSWPEVVDLFAEIGRGLAAVHRAGLVHRDLKPANVMIGRDGRARVMDFGLARVDTPELTVDDSLRSLRPASDLALTRPGARLGTPLYMSPEQWLGEPSDARSDQFSYCVALWEAVHGERPFVGATPAQLMSAVVRGEIVEPRGRVGAPRWLRALLRRGLAPDPAARFPDMDALLAALLRGRRAAVLRLAGLVGLVVAGGLGLVASWAGLALAPTAGPCDGVEARLVGVWDDERRAAGEAAFLATGKAHAAAAWRGVAASLDGWAAAWIASARESCVATRVHGVRSEHLHDRQMACLDRRADEVRGLVDLLARADADVVAHAARAFDRLTPLAGCADADALLAAVPPPALALAARVAALRSRLDRAKPLADALAFGDAEAALRPLLAESDALGYHPLRAEVRRALAHAVRGRARFDEAEALLLDALAAAELGQDPGQSTAIRRAVVGVLVATARLDEALLLSRLVTPELDRPGREAERADFEAEIGRVHAARGDLVAARRALERALALLEGLHGPDGAPVAGALDFLSYIALLDGRIDDALALAQRGVDVLERHLGPDHPRVLSPLTSLGDALTGAGRLDEARATYERALALAIVAHGAEHPEVGHCHWSLGDIAARRRDREAAARHYESALAITERAHGPDHPDTAECLFRVATTRAWQGAPAEAERLLARVVEIHARRSGDDSYLTLRARGERALRLADLGRLDEALTELGAVVAAIERTQGESDELVLALVGLGDLHLRAERPADAIGPLERALELTDRGGAHPDRRAQLALLLARALWDGGGERARARALAGAARERWRGLGEPFADDLASADQWLSDHVVQDISEGR